MSSKKASKKTGTSTNVKGHRNVAVARSLDGTEESERRKGSGLREVETVEDSATMMSDDVAPTTRSGEVDQEERPLNKTSSSF